MSLIIRVNQNAPDIGQPVLQRRIFGFPAAGLVGLYLMDEAAIDAPVTTVHDHSGNNNHAVLRAGYTAPVQKTHGLAITATNGAIFDTPIAQSNDLTIVIASRLTGAYSGGSQGFPTLVSNSLNNTGGVAANGACENGVIVNVDEQNNNTALHTPGVTIRAKSPSPVSIPVDTRKWPDNAQVALNWRVHSVQWEHVAGRLRQRNGGYTRTDTVGAGATMAATGGVFTFGCMRYFTGSLLSADLGVLAIYNTSVSDADVDTDIVAAKAVMSGRGVTAT